MQSASPDKSASQSTSGSDRVPVLSKAAYGLGTALDMWGHWLYPSVAYAVFNIYLGVSPALIGVALMLNRLADALSDPFFGWLSDNTRTRFGRRRPFLLLGGIVAGIGLPMLFLWVSPAWSEKQIFVYMLASSLLYVPLMSSFNMPFQSLGAEMSPDYNERTSVMSYKGAIQKVAEIGNFCALQFATMSLFSDSDGRLNTLRGMQVYTCILGGIMALIGIIMFFSIRERYYAQVSARKQEKVKLTEAFFETLKCKPFRIQLLFTMAFALGNSMVGTLGYYATVYVACGGNEKTGNAWNTWMGVASSIGGILGATILAKVANSTSKRQAAILTCLLAYLAYGGTWWLYNPDHQWLQVFASGGIAFVCAAFWMLSGSMGADVMDYDELNTGKRREGSFSACSSYTQKLGLSLGAGCAGLILSATGFDAKLGGAQHPETLTLIRLFLAGIPIFGVSIALWLVLKFPLTREKVAELRQALELKRGKV
jgi:GPH family glycoside/pentoside/hexuronide:cation symporter